MKKLMRITYMERYGVTGTFKPCTAIVNKKFCENFNINYPATAEDVKVKFDKLGIKIVSLN